MRILVIDNYDSFVYNLVQLVGRLHASPIVYRNDALTIEDIRHLDPDAIILSPGPGHPADRRRFGVCGDILHHVSIQTPTLGVCLGHQGIVHAFGGKIIRAGRTMHGKTSRIKHDGHGVFSEVRNPFTATRYHSLVADRRSIPNELQVSALALDDGEVMGVRHAKYPIEGVQFHPESILTHEGAKIMANFLRMGRR